MKYLILLLLALAFAAGMLGFTLFLGTVAFVFRIAFVALLVIATALLFVPKKAPKSAQSTFAESFNTELSPSPSSVPKGEHRLTHGSTP